MGSQKYYLLVVTTVVVLVALVNKAADAHRQHQISEQISKSFPNAKENFNMKADVGGDGNIVIKMAADTVTEIDKYVNEHFIAGPKGEVIHVFTDGLEKTIKMIANALDEAFDVIDKLLSIDIEDKGAAIQAIINGMNAVRSDLYKSGAPAHSCLGAGKSMANMTDKGEYKFAVEKIEQGTTALFEDLEAAQFFAMQGLKASEEEITKKCLKAAHAAIKSAAETVFKDFLIAARKAIDYLFNTDEDTITKEDPAEKMISEQTKLAASADSDTVVAIAALEKEFDEAISKGISAPILNEIKYGLEEYIEHSSLCVAMLYSALEKANAFAKTDPEAAVRVIDEAFPIAKSILIDGSVKAYEALGSAGRAAGGIDYFEKAIEVTEKSRIDGAKGLEYIKDTLKGMYKNGESESTHISETAHKMLEANEAIQFGYLHQLRHIAFDVLNPGAMGTHKHQH